jgi:hypothetical protein
MLPSTPTDFGLEGRNGEIEGTAERADESMFISMPA